MKTSKTRLLSKQIVKFMNKEEFQYFIIFMVLIDLIILMVQQVLTLHHLEGYITNDYMLELGHNFLFVLCCMVLSSFVIELSCKIVLVDGFLKKKLNFLDTLITIISVPVEIYLQIFNTAINQAAAPVIIIFRFYKILRAISNICDFIEKHNKKIIEIVGEEKALAMARVNNYQSMIHELSKQVLEKEEKAQEAQEEQDALVKQLKDLDRELRKEFNRISANSELNKVLDNDVIGNKEDTIQSNVSPPKPENNPFITKEDYQQPSPDIKSSKLPSKSRNKSIASSANPGSDAIREFSAKKPGRSASGSKLPSKSQSTERKPRRSNTTGLSNNLPANLIGVPAPGYEGVITTQSGMKFTLRTRMSTEYDLKPNYRN